MFNLWTPISYNTDINPFICNYITGGGFSLGSMWSTNPFSGSLFNFSPVYNFGNTYNNPFASNIFNSCGLDSFGGLNNFGGANYFNSFNDSVFSTLPNGNFIGPEANYFAIDETKTATEPKKVENTDKAEKTNKSENPKTIQTKKVQQQKATKNNSSNYIGTALVKNASKYIGYNEADGSFLKFSDSPEWCADFVTYVVLETYKEKGLQPPPGFGNHRTEILKQWSIDNKNFFNVANKNNRGKLIAQNVKPGDIMILRENGASHTGFVTAVHSDGTFETIEGNRNDKVTTSKYSPDYKDLSGFIQLRA